MAGRFFSVVLWALALSMIGWSLVQLRSPAPSPALAGVDGLQHLEGRAPEEVPEHADVGGSPLWHLDNDGRRDGIRDADIDGTEARALTRGQGIVVAVIDREFNGSHELIRDSWWVNRDEIAGNGRDDDRNGYVDDRLGWDFVGSDNNPFDMPETLKQAHGTASAGLVRMVAPDAQLMPLAVIGSERVGDAKDIAAAILYAGAQGADVITLSLGVNTEIPRDLELMERAIEKVDLPVIAAAGNDGADNDAGGIDAFYPAALETPNVIGVAASDARDQLWSDSNYGPASVELAAPGVNVWAPARGTEGWLVGSGTSSAAPQVAGTAALLLSINPDFTPSQVLALLEAGSEPLREVDAPIGFGRLNAMNSVKLALVLEE